MLGQKETVKTQSAVVSRTGFYTRNVLFSAFSGWALRLMFTTKSASEECMSKLLNIKGSEK